MKYTHRAALLREYNRGIEAARASYYRQRVLAETTLRERDAARQAADRRARSYAKNKEQP